MATLGTPINLLSLTLLLLLTMSISLSKPQALLQETKMSLYFQDFSSGGSNATVLPVAGIAGKLWSFTQFGTTFVTDDPITETPDPKAVPVGRAQGIYVTASLDGLNSHVMISIVFTNKAYNGSTLEIQGNSKQFEAVREVSIVSGTGMFRYARGYATFETYYLDIPAGYSIIRCNLSVLHCQECYRESQTHLCGF